MANIQQLLNDEIRRLARKETSGSMKEIKAQLVELRRAVAELNRRLKALEGAAPQEAVVEENAQQESKEQGIFSPY